MNDLSAIVLLMPFQVQRWALEDQEGGGEAERLRIGGRRWQKQKKRSEGEGEIQIFLLLRLTQRKAEERSPFTSTSAVFQK